MKIPIHITFRYSHDKKNTENHDSKHIIRLILLILVVFSLIFCLACRAKLKKLHRKLREEAMLLREKREKHGINMEQTFIPGWFLEFHYHNQCYRKRDNFSVLKRLPVFLLAQLLPTFRPRSCTALQPRSFPASLEISRTPSMRVPLKHGGRPSPSSTVKGRMSC